MSKLTRCFRTLALVGVAHGATILAGCNAGPLDQPDSALPALSVQVRFGETPPDTAARMGVRLAPIRYCFSEQLPVPDWGQTPLRPWTPLPLQQLDRGQETTDVMAYSDGDVRAFGCPLSGVPVLRFFEPDLFFDPTEGLGPSVPWVPRDTLVVYADSGVTFRPYGPADEPLTLPPGYSILRRTCGGGDRPWRVERVNAAEPITFQPSLLPNFYPQPNPGAVALREQSERLLLKECGVERPEPALGTRLTFDRATSIQFSADGAQVLYLAGIDPADAERLGPLRSVDVTTGALRQVAAIRDAYQVQTTTRPGEIYVRTQTDIQRIDLATEMAAPAVLPWPRSVGSISPDGRWFSYSVPGNTALNAGETMTWIHHADSELGRALEPGTWLWGWTPDSNLMVRDVPNPATGAATNEVVIQAPGDGAELRRYSFAQAELAWSGDVPYALSSPVSWLSVVGDSEFAGDSRGMGLSVQAPGGGDATEVLGPSAGSVTFAARTDGAGLVWARRCLGLFETVCSYELHRITVPALDDRVVAVAHEAAPVAVSPAGDRIAIAAQDGIFIHTLP